MPTRLVTLERIDLDKLHPEFLGKLLEVLAACQARHAHYFATYGYRSFPEQARLYFQGRTLPGPRVTNAGPGLSLHNYGLAVDLVRDHDLVKVGLQPDWKKEGYAILAEEGAKLGLQVGVPGLGDWGHVQLPKPEYYKKERDWMLALKHVHDSAPKGGELKAVWAHLDANHQVP